MFADDIVLLAQNKKKVQLMIKKSLEYLAYKSLTKKQSTKYQNEKYMKTKYDNIKRVDNF